MSIYFYPLVTLESQITSLNVSHEKCYTIFYLPHLKICKFKNESEKFNVHEVCKFLFTLTIIELENWDFSTVLCIKSNKNQFSRVKYFATSSSSICASSDKKWQSGTCDIKRQKDNSQHHSVNDPF